MAISVLSSSSLIQTGFAAGGERTWSHSSNGNMLVVSAGLWQDVAGAGTISAVAVSGNLFTRAGSIRNTQMQSELWYLFSPPTGNVTISASVSGNTDDRKFGALSLSGADTTGLGATMLNVSNSSPITTSITTVGNNSFVADTTIKFSSTSILAKSGQLAYINSNAGTTAFGNSYKGPIASPSTISMTWDTSGNDDRSMVLIEIKAAPVITTQNFLNLLGVS